MRLHRAPPRQLTVEEECQAILLKHPRATGVMLLSELRMMLKNRLKYRGVANVSASIRAAVSELVNLGILQTVEPSPQNRTGLRKAEGVLKSPWRSIAAKPLALQHLQKLNVLEDAFM